MVCQVRRFFVILLVVLGAVPGLRANGFINVRNFPKTEYQAGTQNWDVVQDAVGRMYFGNRDGMLVYDGIRWRMLFLPNFTTVRSLLYDSETSRIYAGGSEEFGYFSADKHNGQLKYTSLIPNLPKNKPYFTEVWNIYNDNGKIWFQTDAQLFCLQKDYINVYPVNGRITTSALLRSTMYVGLEDGRVMNLRKGRFQNIAGADVLAGKRITCILPYRYDGLLIGTSLDGLYVWDGKTVKPYTSVINDFLKANQLFCATQLDDTYAFGTVNKGVVTIDMAENKIKYINKETGLQNNTILKMGFDNDRNLWMCLDNGIDYAILNSPITSLISSNHTIGAGYSSLLLDGKMFFGTNQGLYSSPYPYQPTPSPAPPQQLLPGQIWSIERSPHGVFVSSDAGIYVYQNNNFNKIDNITGAYKVVMLPGADNTAIASTYDAFHVLRWDNGRWYDAGKVEGYNDINGDFIITPDRCVWIAHWRKGVYRLRYDDTKAKFYDTRLYDANDGFPSNENNEVGIFDNHVIFSTRSGFYTFRENAQQPIQLDDNLNKAISVQPQGELQTHSDGTLSFINRNGIFLANRRNDNKIHIRHTPLGTSKNELLPGFVHINYLPGGEMVVSTQEGFSSINPYAETPSNWNPSLTIGAVYANRDSLVYSTPLDGAVSNLEMVLPYNLNSLRFDFMFPVYDYRDRIEYSSYLENYENEWSPYSDESYREYTRLDEGDYVMHVRMRDNRTGLIQNASMPFTISPPWFRSWPAKTVYYVAALFFLFAAYSFARKRIVHSRRLLENRKEAEMQKLREQNEETNIKKDSEIASLKTEQLEQDIMHKSRELSSATMSLIHLNEVLTEISTQLTGIQNLAMSENPKSAVLKPLARIRESIEGILSNDTDSTTFYKNFDIVYGDFTKRLMERFPTLTVSDKRLCCYIRMGLSSKEIAPLINISYKSVEMARYRLRKKLNLSAETSLTDFLSTL